MRGPSRPLRIAPRPYRGSRPHPRMQKGGLAAPSPFTRPVPPGLVVVQHLVQKVAQALHLIPGHGDRHLRAVQRGEGVEGDVGIPVALVSHEHHGAVVGLNAAHRLHAPVLVVEVMLAATLGASPDERESPGAVLPEPEGALLLGLADVHAHPPPGDGVATGAGSRDE